MNVIGPNGGQGLRRKPTARDKGFPAALEDLHRAWHEGLRPAPLTFTTLQKRRAKAFGLKRKAQAILLTAEALGTHLRWLDFSAKEWRQIEKLIARGKRWKWQRQEGRRARLIFASGKAGVKGRHWFAVIEPIEAGLILVSAFRSHARYIRNRFR